MRTGWISDRRVRIDIKIKQKLGLRTGWIRDRRVRIDIKNKSAECYIMLDYTLSQNEISFIPK